MSLPPGVFLALREPEDARFYPSVIPVQSFAPAVSARVWLDTSTVPAGLKVWDGLSWVGVGVEGPPGDAVAQAVTSSTVLADRALGTDGSTVALGDGTSTFATLPDGRKFPTFAGGDARWQRDLGIVNVKAYGAVGDGSTDDTAAIQAAITAGAGGVVFFPPGNYVLTSTLTVPADTFLAGAGSAQSTLNFSTMATWTNSPIVGLLNFTPGTIVSKTALAADVAAGDGSVTVATAAPFAVGDFIRITSTAVSFTEAIKAEIHRIVQISGTTLYLSSATFNSYAIADTGEVELLDLATAGAAGFTVRGKGLNPASLTDDGLDANRGDNGLMFAFCRDIHVTDLRFIDVENRCLRISSCHGVIVRDCSFTFDPARVRLQYGISLNGATQSVMISGCTSVNDRHMVTTSTSTSTTEGYRPERGIPRLVTITGCSAYGSWQDPIDTHKGGEYLTITGNALATEATGVKVRGTRVVVSDNIITGKRTSPYSTSLTGVRVLERMVDVRVADNVIRGFDFGVGLELPDGTTNGITIQGNTIMDCNRCVSIVATTPVAGVTIKDNDLTALSTGYPVYVAAPMQELVIDGNTIVGGVEGIRATNDPTQTMTGGAVRGNHVRGSSGHGMFLRNLTNFLVTGNHVTGMGGSAIRLAGNNTRVSVTNNYLGTSGAVSDLSDTRTTLFIGMNWPVSKPSVPAAGVVTADDLRAALIALGIVS